MDAERIARNDATFREANETIATAARRFGNGERAPFICECADPACREVLRLTLAEYEALRASPTHFAVVPGHDEGPVTEQVGGGLGYVVVRKLGKAASTAAELDPRSP